MQSDLDQPLHLSQFHLDESTCCLSFMPVLNSIILGIYVELLNASYLREVQVAGLESHLIIFHGYLCLAQM